MGAENALHVCLRVSMHSQLGIEHRAKPRTPQTNGIFNGRIRMFYRAITSSVEDLAQTLCRYALLASSVYFRKQNGMLCNGGTQATRICL